MRKLRTVLIAAVVVAGAILPAIAEDAVPEAAEKKKAKKAKKPKPALVDVELAGVITKTEVKKGDKTYPAYLLTTSEGEKIKLPTPKPPRKKKAPKKDDAPKVEPIKMDEYVDAAVKVTAKAIKIKRKDKETVMVKRIVSIEKMAEEE